MAVGPASWCPPRGVTTTFSSEPATLWLRGSRLALCGTAVAFPSSEDAGADVLVSHGATNSLSGDPAPWRSEVPRGTAPFSTIPWGTRLALCGTTATLSLSEDVVLGADALISRGAGGVAKFSLTDDPAPWRCEAPPRGMTPFSRSKAATICDTTLPCRGARPKATFSLSEDPVLEENSLGDAAKVFLRDGPAA
jgi:hypothetical protein